MRYERRFVRNGFLFPASRGVGDFIVLLRRGVRVVGRSLGRAPPNDAMDVHFEGSAILVSSTRALFTFAVPAATVAQ
jgi:hypothetical protein